MESLHLITMTTFLLCLLLTTATATDFIRANCNDTSFPSSCYTTLSPHAVSINNSNALLAEAAISISLNKSEATAAYVARLSKTLATVSTAELLAPAVDDCVSKLTDAAELARESLKQMKEIISVNSKDHQFVVSKARNIQRWMSAALSNQVSCINGFEKVADGLVKEDVVKRVGAATIATSNALALINKFVNA